MFKLNQMERENILFTGATGAFGKYLFREFLDRGARITVLVRAADDGNAIKRMAGIIQVKKSANVRVIRADLSEKNAGLNKLTYLNLQKSVTGIVHAASSTRFNLSLTDARISNVFTLKNILDFASGSESLNKFGYLSSAFVAGKAIGEIREKFIVPPGFVNSYDQTKFEAEQLIKQKLDSLPIAIYRPSLVVAPDSDRHHAAVAVLSLIKNGLLPILPGQPDDLIDMVSANYAAESIAELFLENFKPGQIYHIVSGKNAPLLKDVVGTAKSSGKIIFTGHDSQNYEAAVRVLIKLHPDLKIIYEKIDCFIKYLCYPKVFTDKNTSHTLGKPINTDEVLSILGRIMSNE